MDVMRERRRQVGGLAVRLVDLAIDLLLPTVVFVLLAPTGLPAALRLFLGGTLLAAKAVGGGIRPGEFRWRPAVLMAAVPTATLVGCYGGGLGDTVGMVAAAVVAALIVIGDLLRTRLRRNDAHRIDGFAVLVLAEVVAGVVLTSISGDARFVLARSSFYLAVGGLVILATTWTEHPFMRDALEPVAAKGDPLRAEGFGRTWLKSQRFRSIYRFVTATLGAVLLIDAVLRVIVIYSYPPSDVAESSLLSGLPLIGLIGLWLFLNRTFVVPRAEHLLDAEMAQDSGIRTVNPPSAQVQPVDLDAGHT
ncbi:VC0807 family protein [Nocardia sp. NPDC052316]|uniref:VC0807 family protein n=1 Tax=Nocardia sp. NPDC052316 TaxID=3364329 RepID=UPI0037C615F9